MALHWAARLSMALSPCPSAWMIIVLCCSALGVSALCCILPVSLCVHGVKIRVSSCVVDIGIFVVSLYCFDLCALRW